VGHHSQKLEYRGASTLVANDVVQSTGYIGLRWTRAFVFLFEIGSSKKAKGCFGSRSEEKGQKNFGKRICS